jgi:hypothetical protein
MEAHSAAAILFSSITSAVSSPTKVDATEYHFLSLLEFGLHHNFLTLDYAKI